MVLNISGPLNDFMESLFDRPFAWPDTSCLTIPIGLIALGGYEEPELYRKRLEFDTQEEMMLASIERYGSIMEGHRQALAESTVAVPHYARRRGHLIFVNHRLVEGEVAGVQGSDGYVWAMAANGLVQLNPDAYQVVEIRECLKF